MIRKKVLIFSTAYLPFVGGAELAVKEITDRLPEIHFDLVTPRYKRSLPKRERLGNVNVYRTGLGCVLDKFFIVLIWWRAWQLHRKNRYDCLWSIMASQASIAAALLKLLDKNLFLVLTLQEGDEEEHLKRYVLGSDFLFRLFIRPWHLMVFRLADRVTAISNYLIERAVRNGVSRERVYLVPNGVDLQRFKRQKANFRETDQNLRSELRLEFGDKILITTSRLVKKNAVGDIIEALRYLPKNVKLLVLGAGLLEKNLKSRVRSYDLRDRVKFIGQVDHEEIPKYLAVADIFVRPSLSEGMGSSFIEAMAAAVPVVGTKVGGIPDFLKDGETGLFVRVDDPKDLASKIKRLLENRALREEIVKNSLKLVEENYSWDNIAKKLKKIILNSRE
jgi:glycosyltransferase involved in cell wall biosynthesis